MPAPRGISARTLVLSMAVFAIIAFVLFVSPGKIADGHARVTLHVPESDAARIAEIRYWCFGQEKPSSDADATRKLAFVAERSGNNFQCLIPFSFEEHGWFFKTHVDTAPLPKCFTVWLKLTDGAWKEQTIATPAPDSNNNRDATLANLF